MFLPRTRFLAFVIILLAVLYNASECKRGGGGRRGGMSRGSTSVWGRSKQSQQDQRNNRKSKSQHGEEELGKKPPEVSDPSKPSAPPAPRKTDSVITKTSADSVKPLSSGSDVPQHTPGNAQRPIGWDVNSGAKADTPGNKNIGWNTNNNPPPSGTVGNAPPPYSAASPGGNYGHPPPPYSGPGGNYGHPPPPYSGSAPNVGPPPPYSGPSGIGNPPGNNYHPGQNFQQSGQYGSHGYNSQPGPYNHQMGGYGNAPMGGGFFGGNKHGGYGGFGGYSGYGGHGMGGYGKKFGGGFGMGFGGHAIRNVAIGLLVWHLVSGFTRRPYNVYNYYNNPEKVPNEIPLPANVITLCSENATALCAPNTVPLCTSEDAIMCVVLAQKTVPCGENSTMKCANSTSPCVDENDKPCKDKGAQDAPINIPCITNATIIGKVKNNPASGLGTAGDTTELCVTTLALPQPEEQQKAMEQAAACQTGDPTNTANSTLCNTPSSNVNVTAVPNMEKTELKPTV